MKQLVDGEPVDYTGLPVDHRETVRLYIEHGVLPGSGWLAILGHQLEAVLIVDAETSAALPQIIRWIHNHAPSECHGSREKIMAWVKARRAERIPPVNPDNTIPLSARCQEASIHSRERYLACSAPATTIVHHDKDGRGYYMCDSCADHNLRKRGGKLIATRTKELQKRYGQL